MKQYCRYCANCTYGDGAYCGVKKKVMRKDEYCVNCGQALDWRVEDD